MDWPWQRWCSLFMLLTLCCYWSLSDAQPDTPTTATLSLLPSPTPLIDITAVTITPSGNNTAGESYRLECSVTVTGSTDTPTITWLDDGVVIPSTDPTRTVSITTGSPGSGYSSTLMFNPLAASHAGTYTCRATLDGAMDTETMNVTVQNPTIAVSIASSVATPMVGSVYTLDCAVTGAEKLSDATTTYQWFKNGEVLSNQAIQTLSFQSLAISDAGSYTCGATVMSSLLSGPITATGTNSVNVTLSLPRPMIVVTSTPTSPIRPIGSAVTLICTVELSPAVDVPVTVTTMWTGPAGFMTTNTAQPVMGSTTSTAMVNSFGRGQSGNYSCRATVSSTSSFLTDSAGLTGRARVTVGVHLSLNGTVYANNSVIPITEIGETIPNSGQNEGLQCITDRMPCCAAFANRAGEWYFPDGTTTVPPVGTAITFYRNRGDDGSVNLNRLNSDVMSPTGLFCCEVPDAIEDVQPICANIVSYSVMITPSATGTPTAGEIFSLNCSVSGTTDPVTYQWFEGPASNGTQLSNVNQLEFSPLLASDAGLYTCQATVGSVMVEGTVTVEIILPAPIAVTVTAPMGTIIAGSSPNLTCTVELSPAVDVPITVDTVWTGPVGTTVTPTNPVMMNLSRYIIMAMIDVAVNGNYTCQATISLSSPTATSEMTSGMTTVAVVPLPSPTNLVVTEALATAITIRWDQMEGADAVEGYKISYSFIITECTGGEGVFPLIPVTLNDGSLRMYTITNTTDTPVEEHSMYTIVIMAVNSVGESGMSNIVMVNTQQAVPGAPQSLRNSSVSVTNITVQWDRVDCRDRNGIVESYRVVYYPTSNSNDRVARTVSGQHDRMYSIFGRPPRTSYTFEVQASNTLLDVRGPLAIFTVSTTAPQNLGFLLDGVLYPNNSVVTVADIGRSFFMSALFCLTPSLECCSDSETPNAASVTREWYLPDGRQLSSANSPFIKSRVSSAVSLHHNVFSSATPPTGVFRCEIPDASGTSRNIYVGIYLEGAGSPAIISVLFDRNSTTLTCTSTGGPPTTVTWRKNGGPINESLYEQSQRLVNAVTATYENVLFNDDVVNFVGAFTCEVSNVRVTNPVQETVELNGVSISRDQLIVGMSATAKCISDAPTTRTEWLLNGVIIESDVSTQELDLVFSSVNDSIHNQVYVCRVTREGGAQAEQNFTAKVDVPPTAITATINSSGIARAGMNYNLTCTAFKTLDGLLNSPTATWTTTGGVAVSNGNGITVSTMTMDETAISTLTFDPLRTSHEGSYSCDGNLTSPALQAPLMPSNSETLSVQISTPDVNITVPPGPLFAGSTTPLTLTCTISINPATDTDVVVTNTWLRGATSLSSSDARVTVSPVSGSQSPFTSTLTLDPLSTVDNTSFTCQARARSDANQPGIITVSEVGDGTVSVIVNFPSPPAVRINPFNSLASAGQPLRLTCSALPQEGIGGTITLTWTRNGMEFPPDVSVGTLLSLSPLRTSHGGNYICTARLTFPEAGVDVSEINTTAIFVQIPSPRLTIRGSPRDEGFFRGLILTFTCLIEIDSTVDTAVTVQGSWERNGTQLEDSSDSRITMINTGLEASPYQTSVRFNSTDFEDAGTYNCSARIVPHDSTFILDVTNYTTRVITVLNFPPQLVNVTDEGVSTAGYSGYTLVCTTDRDGDLSPMSTLTLQWLDSEGNLITSGDSLTITGSQGPSNDISLTSRLTFNSLLTSQAGLYTCRTLLTIPGTVIDHPVEHNFTVAVKLPAPEVVTIQESRGSPIYEGTMFILTCLITPNMTGVDTDITIQRTFTGPGTSAADRVTREDMESQTTLTFRPVVMTDGCIYVCSATAVSTSQYLNVDASDATMNDTTTEITMLPLPVVNITATPNPTAGQAYTLDCSARTEDYVISVPNLEWVNIDSSDTSITQPQQISGTVSANRSLTFNPIHTSHGHGYTCRASIDIPLANISNRSNSDTGDVRVQIPTSVVVVNDSPFPAYNGTVFDLTGVLWLNMAVVDTDVTVVWVWSRNGEELQTWNTTTSPHQITIPFQPLATNSSGLYHLNLTILPRNSEYVVENSDSSTSHDLVVLCLPLPIPSIAITARATADGCSEARNFTCTATTVDNIFTRPTIEWRVRGNRVPSTGNPRMDSATGQLIFDDIINSNTGDYTCRADITIPAADINSHINETTTTVSTDMPAKVQNLMCNGSPSEMSFSLTWEKPVAQGSGVVGYRVEAQRVEQQASRELISVPLSPAYDEEIEGTQADVIQGLQPAVPYSITVKALNLAGCGEEQQVYCFTQEGVPPPPENVVVVRFDSTSIGVSWTKFTLVELKGLASYVVTYNIIIGSRKRQLQGMMTVPWTENQVIIRNLQPGAEYDVTVSASTRTGISDPVGPGVSMTTSPPTAAAPVSSGSDNTVAIIAGSVVIVLIIAATVVTIIVIVIIALIYRNRRAEFKPNQSRPLPYEEPGGVMLSDLSSTNKERGVYETVEADHEYEILDKYNQAYEEVQASPPKPVPVQPQPTSSAGDYEFTDCPAYIPVATTSVHGNTKKPDTLTSVQPATAQDDQKDK